MLSRPGAFLVDLVPALRHLPGWMPGGGARAFAQPFRDELERMLDMGFDMVKERMAGGGEIEPCFLASQLEDQQHEDHLLKWAAVSIQVGGSDTTEATIEGFFLAMMLHPDAQAAARAEIDAVVGRDRLPALGDRADLPYVNALCLEVLRWHNASPTGVPHSAPADFVYEQRDGLGPVLIPKGAMVIPNVWKMMHDGERYPDPMTFRPERFLGAEAQADPRQVVFGYGRRSVPSIRSLMKWLTHTVSICPGQQLADSMLFLTCAAVLSTLTISPVLDDDGRPVMLTLGGTTQVVRWVSRRHPAITSHVELLSAVLSRLIVSFGQGMSGLEL
ncbi:unnamed protein product [Mycena citricolor]|uniref:Cytochrome P450 n=1 Tax=Mycena citricolor TaxID=2018698 RepID=A0AAD2HUT8_9AGAR|nr:unnamed protein product [Mycena citricolor]